MRETLFGGPVGAASPFCARNLETKGNGQGHEEEGQRQEVLTRLARVSDSRRLPPANPDCTTYPVGAISAKTI